MMVNLAAPMQSDSIVDGEGIRSVIWFQGCSHNCEGCHNPETHSFEDGTKVSIDEIKEQIKNLEFQNGVTFSGGDPMFQPEALYELAKCVHDNNMNVWVYSGFVFEKLLEMAKVNPIYDKVLNEIDVLVDGKFELAKKNFLVKFRGSTNQRIIDVKSSLSTGEVVEVPKYIFKEE